MSRVECHGYGRGWKCSNNPICIGGILGLIRCSNTPHPNQVSTLQRSSTIRLFTLKLVQWAYVLHLVVTWEWCGGGPVIASPELLEFFGLSGQPTIPSDMKD